jgi:hypothetical protein
LRPDARIFCAYKGDFDGDGRDEIVGIAVQPTGKVSGRNPPYKSMDELVVYTKRTGMKDEQSWVYSGVFKLQSAKVKNFGLDSPSMAIVYEYDEPIEAGWGNKGLAVLRREKKGFAALYFSGDDFDFYDSDNNGSKEIVVKKRVIPIINAPSLKKPIDIISLPEVVRNPYAIETPLKVVEDTKQSLARAAVAKDYAGMQRIKDTTNPYLFAAAFTGLLDSPGAETLYRELFGMEQTAFIDHLLSMPNILDPKFLAVTALQWFAYHVETRNDHLIGYDPGRGHTVTFEGQVYSGLSSREAARQEIARLERRRQEEANRPSAYHTFVERKSYPGGESERRTTIIGDQRPPAQWEREKAAERDTPSRIGRSLSEGDTKGAAKEAGKAIGQTLDAYREGARQLFGGRKK